ncbi:hypothetical protein ACMFMF_009466 [Clarireedia jacksonii]
MARKYGKKRPVASAAATAIFGAADSTTTATIPPSPARPALAEITNLLERTTLQENCVDITHKSKPAVVEDEPAEITKLHERTTIKDTAKSIAVLEKTVLKDDTLDEIVVSIEKVTISPSPVDEAASPIPLPALKPALAASLAPLLDAYEIDRGYPLATKKWDDVLAPGSTLEKIAEASYAEVFRITNPIGSSILKLLRLKVPTDPTSKKSDTAIKVETVVSEMRLMNALTEIPGFVKFKDAHIVEGKPPTAFVEAYEAHVESAEESYFPHPNDISEAAVFLAIELGDAGCVLEQCKISNIHQMWDIFLGVVIALARAEIEYQFEHRDLHENNICILQNPQSKPYSSAPSSPNHKYGNSNVEVTILDYGLSRASLPSGTTVFYDLEQDICVFRGESDSPIASIQFANYRRMRTWLYSRSKALNPKYASGKLKKSERHGHTWEEYTPYTNVLWIHFLLEYLTSCYKGRDKRAWNRDVRELREWLDPDEGGMESAGDVLQYCYERGWIGQEDLDEVGSSMLRDEEEDEGV